MYSMLGQVMDIEKIALGTVTKLYAVETNVPLVDKF